jgi:ATP-dependent DNA helicase RecG
MGVIGGPEESPFPINVGLMMFTPEPWRFFPVMQIDVVWFPKEGPGGNKFSEKIFKGSIPRMTRDALDYIRRNLISETVIKHHGRAETTRVENFPYDAIEEAVVNAVYHRGYDVREPVEIRIMHDELVVLSYPGPDRSVRLDQLRLGRAHPRRYRNRRIGEFLKELEFTEGRSTGIPKIMEAMARNGSPPAEFEFDEDHSYFMVRLPVHPAALEVAESTVGAEKNLATPPVELRPESEPRSEPRLESGLESGLESETSGKVLVALAKGPLNRSALADALGHERVSGAINRAIKELLAKGLVEYTIPEKPNSRLQKYRLAQGNKHS